MEGLWRCIGVEDADRLQDTQTVALAALAVLGPRLEVWQVKRQALEARCTELEEWLQIANGQLGGDLQEGLLLASVQPWRLRAEILERLMAEAAERQLKAHALRGDRRRLLVLLGRPEVDSPAAMSVKKLERDIAQLSTERDARLAEAARVADALRGIFEELAFAPAPGSEDARILMSDGGFGVADVEHAALLERLAFWESQRSRRLAVQGSAQHVRAMWASLGEVPQEEDDIVVRLLAEGIGSIAASGVHDGLVAKLDERRRFWEARCTAAAAELSKLHRAMRGFASREEADHVVSQHCTVHRVDRDACRQALRRLQKELLEQEKPFRGRLQHIYEAAGLDMAELEEFFVFLEESESAAPRRAMLKNKVERLEAYFASVSSILESLNELKSLVMEGAKFEQARAAEANRFSGNSLHFLEEERFRKAFVKRYPQLRDGLISKIELWEASEVALGKRFVYHGAAVRDRLAAMRGTEADLLSQPGDLGLVGILLQLLDVKDITLISKGSPAKAHGGQAGRPPRNRSAAELRAEGVLRPGAGAAGPGAGAGGAAGGGGGRSPAGGGSRASSRNSSNSSFGAPAAAALGAAARGRGPKSASPPPKRGP